MLHFSHFISGISIDELSFDFKGQELTLPFGVSRLTVHAPVTVCMCSCSAIMTMIMTIDN